MTENRLYITCDCTAADKCPQGKAGTDERCKIPVPPAMLHADYVVSLPMILTCPACGERHIDEGEFVEKLHHTHACQGCGMVWRPAKVPTVGVRFLPGFKN